MLKHILDIHPINSLHYQGIIFDDYVLEKDNTRSSWAYMCSECRTKYNELELQFDDNVCSDVTCSVEGCNNQDDIEYMDFSVNDFCFFVVTEAFYPEGFDSEKIDSLLERKYLTVLPFPSFQFNTAELKVLKPENWKEVIVTEFNQFFDTNSFTLELEKDLIFSVSNAQFKFKCSFITSSTTTIPE